MKLLEIAKRGSGRMVRVQLTLSELMSIISMFEAVLHDQDLGYSKEKKMKATLHNILEVADDIIKRDVPYKNYGYQSGKVYYESEEGELDAIQQFVEKGTRDGLQ